MSIVFASLTRTLHPGNACERLGQVVVLLLLLASGAAAQTTSVTDGKTPTGLMPGAPAGSYALSGFENVNLFNGNLSFRLPLLNIGGRGSAGYTMMLPIEQKWIIKKGQTNPSTGNTPLVPNPNWWQGIKPGYGPGVLQGRRTGYGEYPFENYCGVVPNVHEQTLTRLTFTAADGTEYELRDQLTNGAPAQVLGVPCEQTGAARGKVFVTADGSSATFLADTTIYDYKWLDINLNNRLFYPSGDLILKDGTRYRIVDGIVSWIRDRNGNQVTFSANTITDSLNRNVTITPAHNGVNYDEISYAGFAGSARNIRVWYDTLSNLLRPNSGFSIQTYHGLFPLNSASTTLGYNPGRVSRIELPDGRQYEFYYNPYGELARVVLPTGGAFEYDWGGGAFVDDELIFRYVTERRVYLVAGGIPEQKTQYVREGAGVVEVKTFNGAGTTLLGRSLHYFYGDPYLSMVEDPGLPSAISFSPWQEGREYKTETFDIVNGAPVLKQTVEQTWQQPAAGSNWPFTQAETSLFAKANDPQITETVTTLADTNQVSKQTFSYDRYSNRSDVYEYDYGTGAAGPLVRRTHTDYLTTNPVSGSDYACNPATTCGNNASIGNVIHLRSLPTQVSIYNAASTLKAQTVFEYDNYGTADGFHAAIVTYPRPGFSELPISGLDAGFNSTTNNLGRGNATKTTRHLLNVSGLVTNSISSYAQFDVAGNVMKVIDPRSTPTNIIATSLDYGDRFGGPDGEARSNAGSTELNNAGKNSYAFPTMITNALGHTSYTQFDYQLGRPVDGEDINGIIASGYSDNDELDRPTKIIRAVNTPAQNQTVFAYDDPGRTITTSSDLNTSGDGALVSKVLYDGLGRTTETRVYEGGSNYIATQQQYDALGRTFKTSNPFRPWQSETPVWTTTGFDALGRVLTVTTPDNAVVLTAYSGSQVLVTDQAGKQRLSLSNALGQLKDVWEITPNDSSQYPGIEAVAFNGQSLHGFHTSYAYDLLDDLTNVTQGAQTRTFAYDSLKRLTSAINPESGTIGYQYDNNGNLTQKTDARAIVSTYNYDALNRNTSVTYTNDPAGTPAVHRYYDGLRDGTNNNIPNSKGRLWQIETSGPAGSRTTLNSFDALGTPTSQSQQFYSSGAWSQTYSVSATYDKASHVLTQTYPSGHTVNYSYDQAGRTSSFSGNLGEGVPRTYASEFQYTALGGNQQEKFGTETPLYHKQRFNQRGQLWDMRLSTVPSATDPGNGDRGALVNYYSNNFVQGGSGVDNNGNLLRQEIYIPGSSYFQQNYAYDSLNRLKSVAEKLNGAGNDSFKQAYTFDRWGNRTVDQTNTTTNVPHPEYTVDPANNNRLLAPAGFTHEYDAAGNQTRDTYTTNSPTAGYRTYDAENRIIAAQKPVTGKVTWAYYTYNGDGQRVRRKVATFEIWQVYGFAGELLAEYPQSGPSLAIAQPQKEYGYRNGELLVTAEPWENAAWNKPATQTDNLNATSSAAKAVDGDVEGDLAEEHAAATNSHPSSWWQVDLQSVQTIDSITVWGRTDCCPEMTSNFYVFVSDNAFTSTDLNTTINQAGVSNYYHSGFAGPTSSSGSTSINVNRTGRYVRVQLAGTGSLALGEVQVWGQAAKLEWLVADQLGTPRLVADKTGTLGGVSRHDYLPYGEELFDGTGGRTTTQRYSAADGVRQQFTGYERDAETGLEYAHARFYANGQGRFSGSDPLLESGVAANPKTWNRYVYALNNPLRITDPTGLRACFEAECSGRDDAEEDWLRNSFAEEDPEVQQSAKKKETPKYPPVTAAEIKVIVFEGEAFEFIQDAVVDAIVDISNRQACSDAFKEQKLTIPYDVVKSAKGDFKVAGLMALKQPNAGELLGWSASQVNEARRQFAKQDRFLWWKEYTAEGVFVGVPTAVFNKTAIDMNMFGSLREVVTHAFIHLGGRPGDPKDSPHDLANSPGYRKIIEACK